MTASEKILLDAVRANADGAGLSFSIDAWRDLKALLAEPRLPAEPSREMIQAMVCAPISGNYHAHARNIYLALYAHISGPSDQLEEIRRYGT